MSALPEMIPVTSASLMVSIWTDPRLAVILEPLSILSVSALTSTCPAPEVTLALAVSTRERSALVPGLPGMREAGLPEYNLEFWYGMFVPAGTPPAIVKKIYLGEAFQLN